MDSKSNSQHAQNQNEPEKAITLTQFSVDQSAVAIYWVDPDAKILYANHTACRSLGYSKDELFSMTVHDIDPNFQKEAWICHWKEIKEKKSIKFESLHKRKNGTVFPVELVVNYLEFGGKEYDCAFAYDISERKQVELALKESERTKDSLLRGASVGVGYVNHRMVGWLNKQLSEITGYSSVELVGKSTSIFYLSNAEYERVGREEYAKANQYGVARFESQWKRKTGDILDVLISVVPIDVTNPAGGYVFTVLDISDRKRAEQNLRKQIERLSFQLSAIGQFATSQTVVAGNVKEVITRATEIGSEIMNVERVGVWFFDCAEEILECTDVYEKTPQRHSRGATLTKKEYEKEFLALKEAKYVDILDAATDPRSAGYFEAYAKPLGIVSLLDVGVRVSGKNIGVICFEHVGTQRAWKSDEITFASQLADQIALTMMNLEQRNGEAELSKSLKEKEILLREIHHRVKNNLQVISSLLHLQSRNIRDKKVLQKLAESQNRIQSIVYIHEKLYQGTDLANINFKDYIYTLVSHVMRSYGVSLDKIEVDFQFNELTLNMDKAISCGLIVNELVSNSIKYAFRSSEKGKIQISAIRTDGHFILRVWDTGKGLPKRFDIEKSDTLGLQLVNSLAREQLGGQIEIDSTAGTCVTITFPET